MKQATRNTRPELTWIVGRVIYYTAATIGAGLFLFGLPAVLAVLAAAFGISE